MTKVGIIASATLATREQNMAVRSAVLIASLAIIARESSNQESRFTMLRATWLRNIPMVPSIATARVSSSERLAAISVKYSESW